MPARALWDIVISEILVVWEWEPGSADLAIRELAASHGVHSAVSGSDRATEAATHRSHWSGGR